MFMDRLKPTQHDTVLDVGFSEKEWSDTHNYLEKHYPYQKQITALGIKDEQPKLFYERYPEVRVVLYDGVNFPFTDKQFDVVWANAVVEHVGGFDRQVHFTKELARTARRGFFTTPNRWFPVEVHTKLPLLHYLPKRIFDAIISKIGFASTTGDYLNLLSYKQIIKMLDAAGITQYEIVRNRVFGFTLDFVIIFES